MALLHPPFVLSSPSVCISCSPIPQPIPNITVSLSFSVGSNKDTNAGQSDPEKMRKEYPSGGTILSYEAQIKRSQTSEPNDRFPSQAWFV